MTFCLIISTMNQQNFDLLKKINVKSDAIVVNQCGRNKEYSFSFNNKKIKWIDSDEIGLSRSRNRALKEVKSGIVLMVDDDERLYENIESKILSEFSCLGADLIAFNINGSRKRYINTKIRRIRISNAFRYGSARLAFKMDFLRKHNISLNNDVGAGTQIGCGEDSIFLLDFLRRRGKCFSSPLWIADICDDNSTWFKDYDKKFFLDKAFIFRIMFPKTWKVICLRYLIKHRKITKKIGFLNCINIMWSIK